MLAPSYLVLPYLTPNTLLTTAAAMNAASTPAQNAMAILEWLLRWIYAMMWLMAVLW
jgi:hypothetical protein